MVEERAPGGVGTAGKYGVTPQGKGGGEARRAETCLQVLLKVELLNFLTREAIAELHTVNLPPLFQTQLEKERHYKSLCKQIF